MSLANDMLSPKGRIAPGPFIKAGLILIAIGFVLSLGSMAGLAVAMIVSLVGLILLWPWIALWIKRLHQAGMSGWFTLLIVAVYMIATWVCSLLVNRMFMPAGAQERVEAAAQSGDIGAVFSASMEMAAALALPNAICNAIVSVIILFLGNMILRNDPGPNAYGPPPEA